MNILITGGNSSLGVELKHYLNQRFKVYTSGRKNCDVLWDWNDDPGNWPIPANIDVLIHCAASYGGNGYKNIKQAIEINAVGTLKVCEYVKMHQIKHLIHISSIFSELKSESYFYNSYSLTKSYSERIVDLFFKKTGFKTTILRPSQFYGVGDRFKKNQPFFYKIIEACMKGEAITFYGSKTPKRNYLFVSDVVEVISRVIDQKVVGTFNFTSQSNVSYEEIALETYKLFNKIPNISFDSSKVNMPDNIFEYSESLYKIIGFTPSVSIQEGIRLVTNAMTDEK